MSLPGLVLAVLWYIAAYTPSLLPRPWWLQGLIAAVCAVLGYAVGYLVGVLWKWLARWLGLRITIAPRRARALLWLLVAVEVVALLAFPFATVEWQHYVRQYVGQPPAGWWYPVGSTLVAVVTFALLISIWRLIADVADWFLARLRSRFIADALARLLASGLTVLTVVAVTNYVVVPAVEIIVDTSADRVNRTQPAGMSAPTSPLRSGGPGSPQAWDSLGQDGAIYVASGPDAAAIARVTGRSAKEPIRVFAGNHDPIPATVDKVLAELDRTGAWDRRAILLASATSTGYLNLWACSTFEHLLDGDTAIASLAYSDLPSAFGLLWGHEEPPTAARALLDAVRSRLDAMPADRRPTLYLTGESLGAYGGDAAFDSPAQMLAQADGAAFDSPAQMLAQADGAVWSGTPAFAPNRIELTAQRNPGSTQVAPVVDNGEHFRFVGAPAQLTADQFGRPLGQWSFPRVAYLQHPSDPVAWWSPSLLFETPPWLQETRLDNPMAQMSWTPIVTFYQLSADMLVSNEVPGGFGHRYYGADMVPAWAAVLGDERSEAELDPIIDAVGRR
nr:alpha/beta-hydrolase family protein [Kineosphaera limosa]